MENLKSKSRVTRHNVNSSVALLCVITIILTMLLTGYSNKGNSEEEHLVFFYKKILIWLIYSVGAGFILIVPSDTSFGKVIRIAIAPALVFLLLSFFIFASNLIFAVKVPNPKGPETIYEDKGRYYYLDKLNSTNVSVGIPTTYEVEIDSDDPILKSKATNIVRVLEPQKYSNKSGAIMTSIALLLAVSVVIPIGIATSHLAKDGFKNIIAASSGRQSEETLDSLEKNLAKISAIITSIAGIVALIYHYTR